MHAHIVLYTAAHLLCAFYGATSLALDLRFIGRVTAAHQP